MENINIPTDLNFKRRLILIDGANFMHGVKQIKPKYFDINDCPNALPLALFVSELVELGFSVRACLLRNYTEQNVVNYFALSMLKNAGLAIEPKINGKEMDDLCLLDIAQKFGAIIVSNDNFHNHRRQINIPCEKIIKFEAIYPSFDFDMLYDDKFFRSPTYSCKLILPSNDIFFVYPSDKDYNKVYESYKKFPEPDDFQMDYVASFQDFIYDRYYLAAYLKLPKNHFITKINKFPSGYRNYLRYWLKNKYNSKSISQK